MSLHVLFFLAYFFTISIISVILTVYDKNASKHTRYRVPEGVLMFIALAFGSLSMYITMIFIGHKTRHPKFMVGLPVLIIFNAVVLYACAYWVKFYA